MKIESKKSFKVNFEKYLSLLVISAMVVFSSNADAQDGAGIFKQKCSACHKIGEGRFVGPDLMGVTTKLSEEWLLKWVKSSSSLIASPQDVCSSLSVVCAGPRPEPSSVPNQSWYVSAQH